MFPKLAKFVISLLALVFATSVLFFGKTGWAAQQTVYRIGVITLFDDPAGIAQINTAIFAVNKINHHLAKRGSTVQLKVLFENGGCNQQDGLKAYMKLRPHTHFIEGGLCSGETLGYGSQAVLDGNFGLTATSSSDALEGPALAGNIKSLSYKNSAISAKLAEQLCAQSGSYAIL